MMQKHVGKKMQTPRGKKKSTRTRYISIYNYSAVTICFVAYAVRTNAFSRIHRYIIREAVCPYGLLPAWFAELYNFCELPLLW